MSTIPGRLSIILSSKQAIFIIAKRTYHTLSMPRASHMRWYYLPAHSTL